MYVSYQKKQELSTKGTKNLTHLEHKRCANKIKTVSISC